MRKFIVVLLLSLYAYAHIRAQQNDDDDDDDSSDKQSERRWTHLNESIVYMPDLLKLYFFALFLSFFLRRRRCNMFSKSIYECRASIFFSPL